MARTKNEIEQQLIKYGFTIWAILTEGDDKKIQAINYNGINVFVSMNDEETFEISWMVPRSLAKVSIGQCSPFWKESHFERQLQSMLEITMKLKEDTSDEI